MKLKSKIKNALPPGIIKFYHNLRESDRKIEKNWTHSFQSWEEAEANSKGYDSAIIYKKVYEAALKVRKGEAVYERDSVLFSEVQHNWPLLSCLLYAANEKKGVLRVLDFGGALGTTYFGCRKFLPEIIQLDWTIVEQEHFVETGNKDFANNELHFANDVGAAFSGGIDLVLISGTLPYLRKPHHFLSELMTHTFHLLLLDRTFFIEDEEDRVVVQNVPEHIYEGNYPCWLFNEKKLTNEILEHNFTLIADFKSQFDSDGFTEENKLIYHKGFYFRRSD